MGKMIKQRLFTSIFLSLCALLLTQYYLGPRGQSALADIQQFQGELTERLEELSQTNERLQVSLSSLRSDPEAVRVASRSMGYFAENEGVIILRGMSPGGNRSLIHQPLLRYAYDNPYLDSYFHFGWLVFIPLFYSLLGLAAGAREALLSLTGEKKEPQTEKEGRKKNQGSDEVDPWMESKKQESRNHLKENPWEI